MVSGGDITCNQSLFCPCNHWCDTLLFYWQWPQAALAQKRFHERENNVTMKQMNCILITNWLVNNVTFADKILHDF